MSYDPETAEQTKRRERFERDLAGGLRGTHRQKVIACFHDPELSRYAARWGTRRQRRASRRAFGLRRRGRKRVP